MQISFHPLTGVVVKRYVQAGTFSKAGAPIVAVAECNKSSCQGGGRRGASSGSQGWCSGQNQGLTL